LKYFMNGDYCRSGDFNVFAKYANYRDSHGKHGWRGIFINNARWRILIMLVEYFFCGGNYVVER
jgi:hypothetical protein